MILPTKDNDNINETDLDQVPSLWQNKPVGFEYNKPAR